MFANIEGHVYVMFQKKQEAASANERVKLWDLFTRPIMRIISINMAFSWLVAAMVTFGLTLNGGNLSGKFDAVYSLAHKALAYISILAKNNNKYRFEGVEAK